MGAILVSYQTNNGIKQTTRYLNRINIMSKSNNPTANTHLVHNDHDRPIMLVKDRYGFVSDYKAALGRWEADAKHFNESVYPLDANSNIFSNVNVNNQMPNLSDYEPIDDIWAYYETLKQAYIDRNLALTEQFKQEALNASDTLSPNQSKMLDELGIGEDEFFEIDDENDTVRRV